MEEKKVIQLLKSKNLEDKLLGVTLAASFLGKEWCKHHFTARVYTCNENIVVDYDDFSIYLGPGFIEYWDNHSIHSHPNKRYIAADSMTIINNKTNDRLTAVPEGT